MTFSKKLLLVLLGVILCVIVLCIIFRPVIADYIQDLLRTIRCDEYMPTTPR